MRCSACGHDNMPDAAFCGGCGAATATSCAECGRPSKSAERFCQGCGKPLTSAPADASSTAPVQQAAPLPASFGGGRYVVRGFLGEGGRKRVYLAHDEKLDRDVAYAAIKTDGLDDDGVTRIRREAQAMGKLGDHPHIVTVFDTGEETRPDGVLEPYIVS